MTYTTEQLRTAFEKVQNKEHWKNPVDAIIPVDETFITQEAIRFFTGTIAEFSEVNKENRTIRVRAIGYRNGPAGDH